MDKYLKNKKVKRITGDIEPQEVFLDSLAEKKEEELGISEKKLEVPLNEKIIYILFGIFILIVILLFASTFYFQVIQGKTFTLLSENNKVRIQLIRPERGVIYDRNLNQLVQNIPAYDLVCDTRDLHLSPYKRLKEIEEIAQIIEKDPEILKKEIEESETPRILIAQNLSYQTLLLLETKIKDFIGCQIEKNTVRDYISDFDISHLAGYLGKISSQELKSVENYSVTDYIGKAGIEKFYEEILRGKPGKIRIEKDALGKIKSEETLSLPEAGKSLVLYLDFQLQEKLIEELEKSLKRIGAKKGAAVALDPKTGGVLALVSLPSFNNSLLSQGISQKELQKLQGDPLKPFLNRIISGIYAVGSTIKPLIASAGLQEKIISPQERINCQGVISVKNPYYPQVEPEFYYYNDWKTHGITDLRKAIAESCNVYFYRLGGGYQDFKGLGVENIKKYLSLFGWGEKIQIDIPGEEKGLIPDPAWKEAYFEDSQQKIWRIGDTYHLSIGQGFISVTPLQVAASFGAIANGSTIYQPQVVQKIVDSEKNLIEEIKPKILRQNFIEPENLQVVREGMREAVTYGSSALLNDLPVKASAKTGTAQTPRDDYYHHWVTVFAPFEDPQIVLTVMIEDVWGLQSATLPVANEVLNWYFTQ